jgi:hypothetical protein
MGFQDREFLFRNEGKVLQFQENPVGGEWPTILHQSIDDDHWSRYLTLAAFTSGWKLYHLSGTWTRA